MNEDNLSVNMAKWNEDNKCHKPRLIVTCTTSSSFHGICGFVLSWLPVTSWIVNDGGFILLKVNSLRPQI